MRIIPKAILTGVFINFGSFIGVSLFYNVAVYLFELMMSKTPLFPIMNFYELLDRSFLINWGMTIICCAITVFGSYMAAKMARSSEWLNGILALLISVGFSYMLDWGVGIFETLIVIGLALLFGSIGCFIAVFRNRREI